MSYTHDRDKMSTIHPDLGKFDFVVAKNKREWAQCKGIGSKEWIEFANLMFEQFPFIYNTCLLMNDQQKSQQSTIDRLTEYEEAVHAHFDVAFHSYDSTKSVYDNLTMLQSWHCAVALDPKVSKEAAELHDKIDRLTEQRDRLLSHLKMAALAADEFWHEHYPDCIDSITSLIAEIEAGK